MSWEFSTRKGEKLAGVDAVVTRSNAMWSNVMLEASRRIISANTAGLSWSAEVTVTVLPKARFGMCCAFSTTSP